MNYVRRDLEEPLLRLLNAFPCVVVTGPRQTGKSTLLTHLLPDYRYVTLDDPLQREQALDDPHFFLDSLDGRAIIDEIQYAPGLLSYVKMIIDRHRDRRGVFVFTGSQQFAMMKNLGETLAGRIALLELLPLGLEAKKTGIRSSRHALSVLSCCSERVVSRARFISDGRHSRVVWVLFADLSRARYPVDLQYR
jgi:uncharacterized protein